MWELDQKEGWAPKTWYIRTVVLEKTLECPLDCKEIKPVNSNGDQSWIFIGRTDAEAEAPIFQPLNGNIQLIGKDPDAEKDWRQEEKGTTEDEMVGWNSLTQWPWVCANSGRWWKTEKPGVLQSLGLQSQIWLSNSTITTTIMLFAVNAEKVSSSLETSLGWIWGWQFQNSDYYSLKMSTTIFYSNFMLYIKWSGTQRFSWRIPTSQFT